MAPPPTSHDTAHLISPKEKHRYQSFKFKQYADFAQTIFIAATIASTIALSKSYEASSKSTLEEDGIILAWASALLVTSIAGSVILVASAKLELAFYLLQMQSLVVSLFVLVAFYLLLATPSFRQQYTGPFLFATYSMSRDEGMG
ncbi:hypothetical protein MW887_001073 [Aspergillus wentii]|nr:hypothetical protein MW887_001073 [Aspergillus wentii]